VKPTQADSEIEEEHLLNCVVNSLDEELAIDLGENVEVTTETLYEVLAGASAGGTSINHVCETTDDSPHANTVRGHLTDQFELDSVEAVGDTCNEILLETLPDRPVEVVADLHLDPYYGDEDETEALYSSQAKRGTTAFHAYATLYARVRNKRYTLAVRQLVAGETTSDVPLSFLNCLTALTSASRPSTRSRILQQHRSQTAVRAQLRLRDADCQVGRNDSGRTQQRLEPRD